jgi:choice-of-anchor B domain-containing protein
MLYRITLLFLLFSSAAMAQNSLNMEFLARWDQDTLPVANPGGLNVQYSGCWGLVANGLEIAVVGGARHVLFFDVTNPKTPKLIAKFAGNQNTVWREFKSYKDRVYAVSDGTTEGLMIFDCSKAPEIKRTYWSNKYFRRSHTITLDTVSARIYLNGTDTVNQGMALLSIKDNLDQPTPLPYTPNLRCKYIHDSYVRNDTIYASSGYEGYCVYDFKNPAKVNYLAGLPATGYNHNSWVSSDGRYAYYTDEIPRNRPIRIIDLKNLSSTGDIREVGNFLNPLMPVDTPNNYPIAHNVYIKNNMLFNSQYEDGLLVYDISDGLNPKLFAYYDTHPENKQYTGYYGNWGNYPWLPSGTIIAVDMQNGLHLLRLKTSNTRQVWSGNLALQVFPNPVNEALNIRMSGNDAADWQAGWQYRVVNSTGQLMYLSGKIEQESSDLNTLAWPNGIYWIEVLSENNKQAIQRVVVQH